MLKLMVFMKGIKLLIRPLNFYLIGGGCQEMTDKPDCAINDFLAPNCNKYADVR